MQESIQIQFAMCVYRRTEETTNNVDKSTNYYKFQKVVLSDLHITVVLLKTLLDPGSNSVNKVPPIQMSLIAFVNLKLGSRDSGK